MRLHILLCLLLGIFGGFGSAQAADPGPAELAELRDKAGLEAALKQFQIAWNSGDTEKLVEATHPDCPVRKAYKDPAQNAVVVKTLKKNLSSMGAMSAFEVRKFIEAKHRYAVQVSFSKWGKPVGSYAARKTSDGNWKLTHIAIDGEGEPETRE